MEQQLNRLLHLRKLLKVERDEDYNQYKQHFLRNNINHRKESGVTWYPVVITNVEIGLGEYLAIDIERTTNHNEPHQFSGGKIAALFSNTHQDAQPINGTIKVLGPNKIRLTLMNCPTGAMMANSVSTCCLMKQVIAKWTLRWKK
jgi:ATP-dependent RNA/DNA helicase IGHMBP2